MILILCYVDVDVDGIRRAAKEEKKKERTHNLYAVEIGTHETASIWWYLIPFFVVSFS